MPRSPLPRDYNSPMWDRGHLVAVDEWLAQEEARLRAGIRAAKAATRLSAMESWEKNMVYYRHAVGAVKWLRSSIKARIAALERDGHGGADAVRARPARRK